MNKTKCIIMAVIAIMLASQAALAVYSSNTNTTAIYNPVPPSLGTGEETELQVDGSGNLKVVGSFFQGTQPVSASSWPLPTNASQENGGHLALVDSKLSTINTTLGSPFQSGGSIGNTAFGISGTLPAFTAPPAVIVNNFPVSQAVTGTFFQTTQPVSLSSAPLPSNASTATAQATENASLSSIDSKMTKVITYGVNGSVSNSPNITTTPTAITAPANAIGFVFEAESTNTDNVRWAIGATASSSVGTIAEPGRDSGYVPAAANISVCAMSGTQSVSVQWVLSQ